MSLKARRQVWKDSEVRRQALFVNNALPLLSIVQGKRGAVPA